MLGGLFKLTNLLIFALSLIMGIFAFTKNRKNSVNFFWFLTSMAISIWSFSLFAVVSSNNYSLANFWQYVLDATAIWVPTFFTIFVMAVISKWESKKIYLLMLLPAVFVTLLTFFPAYKIGLIPVFIFKYWINPGSLYFIAPLTYSFYVLVSLFLLIKYIRLSRGSKRQQLRYILLAALIGFAGGATNYFPQLFEVYPFGNYFIVFYLVFITYAIVKHRLMDIRMVVARSVAYTILVAILAGFYAATVLGIERLLFPSETNQLNLVQGIIRTILAVIMAFSFQPLKRWITKATDKIFFKNQYNAEEFLDTLAHTIGSTIILIELVYKTLALIREQMKITRAIIVILTDSGSIYNSQALGYKDVPNIIPEDMVRFAKDGVLVGDELDEGSRFKHLLQKYNASVAIPLKTENTTEGVLLLGEKLSGDMYSEKDLQVFEIIAPELAVAITNAKAFEKIEKFNVTLRQEIKKATAELEKKNEQLRELDKAKDEFISMASHQLRTPLTAIKGYLSMLLEGDAGEIKVSQYDFVNEAFQGANRMVGLINDLLNVSRMETGRFFLEPVEVDLDKIVQEEVKQLQNHAKEKKLYLKYEQKGKVPHVWVDETKVRQVIMNFMDNAIYYTTNGGVTVTLEADKSHIIYKVTDTGIGVPKSQQQNLFTKFYRADNARHIRPDGTGLGIYLAKKVVDDHSGELIFHSVEGKGSTFGFKLPLKSKLKTKRVAAPAPGSAVGPGIGELAAGIGVNPAVLEATQSAGIEHPLADSSDKKDLEKEVVAEPKKG